MRRFIFQLLDQQQIHLYYVHLIIRLCIMLQ